MAQKKDIIVSGALAGLIFYQMNGKYYKRTKPLSNKQTKATRLCASYFGLAQSAAGNIRNAFPSVLADREIFDRKSGLATPIQRWILNKGLESKTMDDNLPFITGYGFNSKTAVAERWKVKFTVKRQPDNSLLLAIPAYNALRDIEAPTGTEYIDTYFAAASCNITGRQLTGAYKTNLRIEYTNVLHPSQEILLPVFTAPGNLTVVFVTLRFIKFIRGGEKIVMEKPWVPGGIVSAMYN